jgi:hypothetical protein
MKTIFNGIVAGVQAKISSRLIGALLLSDIGALE